MQPPHRLHFPDPGAPSTYDPVFVGTRSNLSCCSELIMILFWLWNNSCCVTRHDTTPLSYDNFIEFRAWNKKTNKQHAIHLLSLKLLFGSKLKTNKQMDQKQEIKRGETKLITSDCQHVLLLLFTKVSAQDSEIVATRRLEIYFKFVWEQKTYKYLWWHQKRRELNLIFNMIYYYFICKYRIIGQKCFHF